MTDVLVIGAGIVGCAVAEALSSAGALVRVIDRRPVGLGATQASGGMLVPHAEGVHEPLLERLGLRSLELYDELIARVSEAGASRPVYARTGSLHVALDDREADELRELYESLHARGVEADWLGGSDARRAEPAIAADCVGAVLIKTHGFVSATDLAGALWRASVRRGASFTSATVEAVSLSSGGLSVSTSAGILTAPTVVVAAGPWCSQIRIEGVPALPVRPVRGQLLRLRWTGPAVSRIVWGARCYTVPWPDRTVLVGATTEDAGFDERATVGGVRDLLDAASELLPRAGQAHFEGVRVGLRPASADGVPIIGRSSRVPGLVYATGHYRNGVLLAPLTGALVARAIAGERDPALDATDPSRFGAF